MNRLPRTTIRVLLMVTLLSIPLGCATLDRSTIKRQDPVPAEGQLTLAPREVGSSRDGGNRPGPPERSADLDAAIRSCLANLERGGDPATTFQKLAALCVRKGDFEQAAEYYGRALRHMPPNAELSTDYGYCLALLGRYHEAEDILRKTIQMDPHAARARNNLGLVLAATGRREEAREAFMQAGADPESTDENLKFATAWSERTSLAAANLPGDPSDVNGEVRRLASIDPARLQEAGQLHRLTSFANPSSHPPSPSE